MRKIMMAVFLLMVMAPAVSRAGNTELEGKVWYALEERYVADGSNPRTKREAVFEALQPIMDELQRLQKQIDECECKKAK